MSLPGVVRVNPQTQDMFHVVGGPDGMERVTPPKTWRSSDGALERVLCVPQLGCGDAVDRWCSIEKPYDALITKTQQPDSGNLF